jgi:hypothetical protein
MGRVSLHSIRTPYADIKPWEGRIFCDVDVNMGGGSKRVKFLF